ncbi:MAG: hypothetical protein Q7U98_15260 [Methylicorpusculum sp.]|uniref:hypothetical protein n=1 Tax=Methylicorpusculum sp. TaxID=2713644 RepID=UPI002715BBCA|nr:hypothetical protein [Methylicorpusculum sp.]MDO8940512.1 hypothetical protein [Methylicorpusculum sp.]MDP2202654.1 hypothetical protein [Methylicorpusculum sp.]
MNTACKDIKLKLSSLFDELFTHEGYADLRVEMRILKRGQKEVILHCGKQYRYVTDFRPDCHVTKPKPAIDYPDVTHTGKSK